MLGVGYLSLNQTIEKNPIAKSPITIDDTKSVPKQQTEYFEKKAKAIEQDTQKRVDELYGRGK